MTIETTVTRTLVPEDRRLGMTAELFGVWFPMRVEPVVFSFAERLSTDYKGGYWDFYTLSNGGFYMVPAGDDRYRVLCEIQFEGDLSADAFGMLHSGHNLRAEARPFRGLNPTSPSIGGNL